MQKLLILVVGLGMLLLSSVAFAEEEAAETAPEMEPTEEGADGAETAVSEQHAESETEDRSEPMTLETKERDDNMSTDFPVGPVILGAYGVVTIVIGAGFGWQADQEYDSYNEFDDNHYPNATEELADDIEKHARVANILMFTGLGVVVGSVIWGVVEGVVKKKKREKEAEAETTAKWRPLLSPTSAGISVEF